MSNWGFIYKGVDFSFVNIEEQASDIMPHSEDLSHGTCSGNNSPDPQELHRRGNMDVSNRGWHYGDDGIKTWVFTIDTFKQMSINQMSIGNFNDIESDYQLILDRLDSLSQALYIGRESILVYESEGNNKHRICKNKNFWRDARDSNREFQSYIQVIISEVQTLKQNALDYEDGVLPVPDVGAGWDSEGNWSGGVGEGGVMPVQGCTDPKASNYDPSANYDNGTCGQKSGAEETLIKVGKVLLALVGAYITYRVAKKYLV